MWISRCFRYTGHPDSLVSTPPCARACACVRVRVCNPSLCLPSQPLAMTRKTPNKPSSAGSALSAAVSKHAAVSSWPPKPSKSHPFGSKRTSFLGFLHSTSSFCICIVVSAYAFLHMHSTSSARRAPVQNVRLGRQCQDFGLCSGHPRPKRLIPAPRPRG